MKYYIIERLNHSGGSTVIALDMIGDPFYCVNNKEALAFVHDLDAEAYMNHCSRNMPSSEGQTDWKVSEIEK